MKRSVELITDARCIVGEGPIWDDRKDTLYSVDIFGKRLRAISFPNKKIKELVLPQQTGFVCLTEDGRLLGGAEDGVYFIDENGEFTRFSKPIPLKGMRFNDGKIGPDGNMYLGTFSRDYSAAFYRLTPEGTLTELFDGVGNSNGLDWSADGRYFYYTDTPTKRTDRFEIIDGELCNRKTLIEYAAGNPDGMTIDEEDNLWVALWGAGKVVKVDTKAQKIVEEIHLPVSQPSCCAFGGEDRKTLFITSAAHNILIKDEPLAGSTFAVRLDVGGRKNYRMKL